MKVTAADYHKPCSHKAYKLTCAQFDELFAAMEGRCQICRRLGYEAPHGMLYVDHDRPLGDYAVRGLLCNPCNSSLGRVKGAFNDQQLAYLSTPWHVGRLSPPPRRPKRWAA
jgi:hypothetical protein